MRLSDWLQATCVLPALAVDSVEELVERVAAAIHGATPGVALPEVAAALRRAFSDEGSAVGPGVAFPHGELAGLEHPVIALAVLARPVPLATSDGALHDVFFCVLSPPSAPEQHLLLLGHLARLTRSRVLLDGLRRSTAPASALALLAAAEDRQRLGPDPAPPTALVVITIAGERAVDALLVDLVGLGLHDATVLEGQSLREAAAREVPLFSGFRDLFGDPGGRRVILVEGNAAAVESVVAAVQAVCRAYPVTHARVATLPFSTRWEQPEPSAASPRTKRH